MLEDQEQIGAIYLGDHCARFRVWSPSNASVAVHLLESDRLIPMKNAARDYHEALVTGISPGALYQFRLSGGSERPDPASRLQPRGVHGPSALIDPQFPWEDSRWSGIPLADYIIYELHVGTFTPEGTFRAAIAQLDYLVELGVTAVELMPVAQFPGGRNWGYDGVYPFAAQDSYGGPSGLKTLVNACHGRGLAVVLDVVYNHLGPEGNYLGEFGPYFTDTYKTAWGPALNFDGPYSDEVREYFVQNALYWLIECHIDALRLDAVHAILDHSPFTFLEQLSAEVKREATRLGRNMFLVAESADNNARLLRDPERGGYGLDAQWNDDFHHSLRTLLTRERDGYYQDYGDFRQLVKAYREGFVYSGEYSPFRKRRHGTSSRDLAARKLIVFSQNHDQIGNRMLGDRLPHSVAFEQLKLAAALVILSPFIPLLFMGEEYGETAAFPYFVSHSDPDLIEAVRRGRRAEFASFDWQGEIPDPQDEATFLKAKLCHRLRESAEHGLLCEFYRELIRLRKSIAALARSDKEEMVVQDFPSQKILGIERCCAEDRVLMLANIGQEENSAPMVLAPGRWCRVLDSAARSWRGPGSTLAAEFDGGKEHRFTIAPSAVVVYRREQGA